MGIQSAHSDCDLFMIRNTLASNFRRTLSELIKKETLAVPGHAEMADNFDFDLRQMKKGFLGDA